MIVIIISIGRLVRVIVGPSERSEAGLHHSKHREVLPHLLKTSFSMVFGFDILFFDFPREYVDKKAKAVKITDDSTCRRAKRPFKGCTLPLNYSKSAYILKWSAPNLDRW